MKHHSESAKIQYMEDIKQKRHLLLGQIKEFNQQAAAFMFTESATDSQDSRAEDEYESSSDEDEVEEGKLRTSSNQGEDSDSNGGLFQMLPGEEVESEKMMLQMPS